MKEIVVLILVAFGFWVSTFAVFLKKDSIFIRFYLNKLLNELFCNKLNKSELLELLEETGKELIP